MYKKIIITLTLLIISNMSIGIEETESLRKKAIDRNNYTSFGMDLSGKKGNSKTEDIDISLFHSQKIKNHLGYFIFSKEYSENNNIKSSDNYFLHSRYNYFLKDNKSFELFYQISQNNFQSLDSRKLIGLSLRSEYSDNLSFGVGIINEKEKYILSNGNIYFKQNRLSNYIVINKEISNNSKLTNTLYYQPNIKLFSDYRLYNNLKLRTNIAYNFNISFSFLVEYDSVPIINVEKHDISYNLGFDYSF
jgi:hypothetical protein